MEEWKDLKEHIVGKSNSSYSKREISNFGRIRNTQKSGKIIINRGTIDRGEPKYIKMRLKINKKRYMISRLVYEYFVGPIPEGYEIDHIDDNSTNNHYTNLQPLTGKENLEKQKFNKKKTGCRRTLKTGNKIHLFQYRVDGKRYKQTFYKEENRDEIAKFYGDMVQAGFFY